MDVEEERVAAPGGDGVLARAGDFLAEILVTPGVAGAPAGVESQRLLHGRVPFGIVPANFFVGVDGRLQVPLQPLLLRGGAGDEGGGEEQEKNVASSQNPKSQPPNSKKIPTSK